MIRPELFAQSIRFGLKIAKLNPGRRCQRSNRTPTSIAIVVALIFHSNRRSTGRLNRQQGNRIQKAGTQEGLEFGNWGRAHRWAAIRGEGAPPATPDFVLSFFAWEDLPNAIGFFCIRESEIQNDESACNGCAVTAGLSRQERKKFLAFSD